MQTISSNERQVAFISKLKTLLESAGAELQVTDDGKSYGMHSGICIISMNAVYDNDGNMIKDFCEFELPTCLP